MNFKEVVFPKPDREWTEEEFGEELVWIPVGGATPTKIASPEAQTKAEPHTTENGVWWVYEEDEWSWREQVAGARGRAAELHARIGEFRSTWLDDVQEERIQEARKELAKYVHHFVPCMLHLPNKIVGNKMIVFFHANGEDIGLCYKFCFEIANEMRIPLIAVEYPTYSIYDSKDPPSETTIVRDGESVIRFLIKVLGVAEEDIIIIGRSIGTGVACQVSKRFDVAATVKTLHLIKRFLLVPSLH